MNEIVQSFEIPDEAQIQSPTLKIDELLQPLPMNPLKRFRSLEIELLEEAEKRPRLFESIHHKLYPSESPILLDSSPLTLRDKDNIAATVLRSPSLSHQEVCSDNGKRKWVIVKHLGKGGCGEVFLARETKPDGTELTGPNQLVALKIVKDKRQFNAELKTMKLLNCHKLGRGCTPKLLYSCKKSRALIMEYLSNSLSHQFEKCKFKLSLKTCLMLAINMLEISKGFYERTGQVHVDIKPSNFCTGSDGKDLTLIDFGYSCQPAARLPGQTGTPLFMAWTIQTIGNTYPAWQDDLESIGYVLMFFIAGGKKGLPWGHLKTHKDISRAKNDITIRDFCYKLKGTEYEPIIEALQMYLIITRNRSRPFDPKTDFQVLVSLFETVMSKMGYANDKMYDWVIPTV